MRKYRCTGCGYIYEPGTPFEELPDEWVCPVCGVGKDAFGPVEESASVKTVHEGGQAAVVTRTYSNGEISVLWVPSKCNHNGNCWKRLPQVFKPKERPWVDIKAADSKTIAGVVEECPTGALSVTWEKKEE